MEAVGERASTVEREVLIYPPRDTSVTNIYPTTVIRERIITYEKDSRKLYDSSRGIAIDSSRTQLQQVQKEKRSRGISTGSMVAIAAGLALLWGFVRIVNRKR